MMKKLVLLFIAIIATSSISAQPNSDYDELTLNGLASYEQLRKEYYIAALYLETFSQDSGSIMNYSGMKRMELRIVIDEWSPRRFAQHWNQAILINNDAEVQEKHADQILAFTSIPHESLIKGDRITIDLHPDSGTTVKINGSKVFNTASVEFFDVLLNTWIGSRPPSSDFKRDILTLPTDQAGTELLTRYDALEPDKARKKQVATWLKPAKSSSKGKKAAAGTAVAATASSSSSAVASTTTVTARSSSSPSKPKTSSAPAPTKTTTKIEAPKPEVEVAVEKPKLPPAPKAEPKPVAKAKPKKAAPAAAAAAAKPKLTEQEKLLKAYRSNVLKLTYLNTQYPKRSMDLKQQGLVVLKIRISRKGKLLDILEEKSTDHSLLNKAARKAVNKSTPYPEVPDNLEGKDFEFTLPFNFKL